MSDDVRTESGKFKKGHVGLNKPLNVEIVQARRMTRAKFEAAANKYLFMSRGEIEAISKDPSTTMLDLMIISLITKAIKDGDEKRFDFLLDRLIGKVVRTIKVIETGDESNTGSIPIQLSNSEKLYMLEAMKKRLEDDTSTPAENNNKDGIVENRE